MKKYNIIMTKIQLKITKKKFVLLYWKNNN